MRWKPRSRSTGIITWCHEIREQTGMVEGGVVSFFGGLIQAAVGSEGGIERQGALCAHRRSGAAVRGSRGHQADTAVAMFVVVPAEELLGARTSLGASRREFVSTWGSPIQERPAARESMRRDGGRHTNFACRPQWIATTRSPARSKNC